MGSLVILVGSWITHTTTATIANEVPTALNTPALDLSRLAISEQESRALIEELSLAVPTTTQIEQAQPSQDLEAASFEALAHKIKRGESLGIIFRKLKLDLAIPYKISLHEEAKQLVSISVGKTLTFKFDEQKNLRRIIYPVNALQELVVSIDEGEIVDTTVADLPYKLVQKSVSGEISSSLYYAALDAGLSNNTVMEMVRIFGWDIDFVLDIRSGDSFHVIYNQFELDGEKISDGDILAAEFTTQGKTHRAIRFEDPNGSVSFYTPEGDSMLGTFLRSPVEFSRISSRFGKRKHPISKKWKTHKGVDYAAARGTPIRATADGKVIHAGNKGGYGKTIVLRHAGRFSTLYAHMNGYAKGVRSGSRVKQGQTIGYVGSTGYSTGPHLHYEFRVDGVHRNSLTYKTPKASSVSPEFRGDFDLVASNWIKELETIQRNYLLAKASETETTQL